MVIETSRCTDVSFYIIDRIQSTSGGYFSTEPLTEHSERVYMYITDVQRRGFSLIDQKLSKLRGSELRRI